MMRLSKKGSRGGDVGELAGAEQLPGDLAQHAAAEKRSQGDNVRKAVFAGFHDVGAGAFQMEHIAALLLRGLTVAE